ncbi:TetR/AcrR family transcriptional regulator [Bailinhaonella thermotolerans]|uniref:TetR/AcrR family transcriptional regulator n=1 Tax=Bailinhaonella thermotolerans TaxID=1070861 RepID=A0A3A4AF51_9ACTN|nr:TetR/AcrR family transcriptional regulator [Bailinhaonella thermotolerans]RJL27131.1 TetR/AcrR family transcriptional regulator [Bailinhaonella thermotolerans]
MTSREQIVTAALRRLNEEPNASMAALAEAAGVSRATLHRHFAGRQELTVAIGRLAQERWERALDEAGVDEAAASGDPARIEATLRDLLATLADVAHEYGYALTEHGLESDPELVARFERLEARELALYGAAQRAGVLRDDMPVRWVSNAVYGLLIGVRDSLRWGDVARRDVTRLLVETFLTGTGARA